MNTVRHERDRRPESSARPSYRDFLDLRPGFLAVPRGFDARPVFRTGFLAAAFAVFLAAVFLEYLRVLVEQLLVLSIAFSWLSSSFLACRLHLPCSPLPCCTNCGPGERSNHSTDDRDAQCCPCHGAGNRTAKGATSRA